MSDEQQFLSEEEEIDQALNSKYTVVLDVFLRPNIATGALAESLIQCLSVVHDAGEVVARVIPRHRDEPASYAQHLDEAID
jgi:hypothetical protein